MRCVGVGSGAQNASGRPGDDTTRPGNCGKVGVFGVIAKRERNGVEPHAQDLRIVQQSKVEAVRPWEVDRAIVQRTCNPKLYRIRVRRVRTNRQDRQNCQT